MDLAALAQLAAAVAAVVRDGPFVRLTTKVLFVADPPELVPADGLVLRPTTLLFRLSQPSPL